MSIGTRIIRDVVICCFAYLMGSLPFSYIFAKMIRGVDITKVGSGNMGATNVLRTAGPVAAAFAFLGDFLKAVLVLLVVPLVFHDSPRFVLLAAGVAVVLGHDFSVFAGFHGGKGVATTFAVVSVVSWPVAIVEAAIWLSAVVASRTVSLASIAALAALPLIAAIAGQPRDVLIVYSLLAVLGIVRHSSNIKRLLTRTEPRLDPRYFRRKP